MMTLAHLVRTARWKLFINIYEKPNRRNLIQSISLGFLINNFIPFKLGDLFPIPMSPFPWKGGNKELVHSDSRASGWIRRLIAIMQKLPRKFLGIFVEVFSVLLLKNR